MLHSQIHIELSSIAGRGLIATQYIPAATILWWLDSTATFYTYEACAQLPPEIRFLCYQDKDRFVLASDGGEYMNHSCNPTAIWDEAERIIASRDLHPGDEVTYDYATCEIDPRLRGTWRCGCGAACCRGIITPYDCLSPTFQAQYPVLPAHTRAFIAQHRINMASGQPSHPLEALRKLPLQPFTG